MDDVDATWHVFAMYSLCELPRRRFLGLRVTESAPRGSSTEDGVLHVRQVLAGGAAAAAGLEEGDALIAVDGESVRSGRQLANLARRRSNGGRVSFRIRLDHVRLVGRSTDGHAQPKLPPVSAHLHLRDPLEDVGQIGKAQRLICVLTAHRDSGGRQFASAASAASCDPVQPKANGRRVKHRHAARLPPRGDGPAAGAASARP